MTTTTAKFQREATAGPTIREDDEESEDEAPMQTATMSSGRAKAAPSVEEEEEEDNTLSLAQMEAALKPEALERFASHHQALFKKLREIAARSAPCRDERWARAMISPLPKEKKYEALSRGAHRRGRVRAVPRRPRSNILVDNLYAFNRRLTDAGRADAAPCRAPSRCKRIDVPRFSYVGNEMDDSLDQANAPKKDKKWAAFAERRGSPSVERIRSEISRYCQRRPA